MLAAYERAKNIEAINAPNAEGLDALGDNSLRIPEQNNGLADVLDEALWELQFFLEMTVPAGEPLAGMAHHKIHNSTWVDLPELPSDDTLPRYLHRPSTAATLNVAATMAMAARLYDPTLSAFPSAALIAAEEAWDAAVANPAVYAPNADREGGGPYPDEDVTDEFYWAAAELFITTGKPEYLAALKDSRWWTGTPFIAEGGDWKFVAPFAQLELVTPPRQVRAAPTRGRSIEVLFAGAERLSRDAGRAALRLRLRADRRTLRLGLQPQRDPDRAGPRHRLRPLGRRALPRRRDRVDGLHPRPQRDQPELHHRLRPEVQPEPALIVDGALARSVPAAVRCTGTLAGGPNSSLEDEFSAALFAERGCAPQACYVDNIAAWSVNELAINWQAALAQFAAWLADQ